MWSSGHDFDRSCKHHLGSSTSKILRPQYQQIKRGHHGAIPTTTIEKHIHNLISQLLFTNYNSNKKIDIILTNNFRTVLALFKVHILSKYGSILHTVYTN